MSHLVAYFGNEPENLNCALFSARGALVDQDERGVGGWALGFIQGGDVLLQKRIRAEATQVDLYTQVNGLKAEAVIARVGFGRQGNVAAENADPFRFRSWLFGSMVSIPGFDGIREPVLAAVPDFLRRNIRGSSAGEHLFHLFLANLHLAGLLDVAAPEPERVKAALEATLSFVGKLLGGSSETAPIDLALATTNGRCLVATAMSRSLQYLTINGISDCPVCRNRSEPEGDGRRVSHDGLRAVIIDARDGGSGHPGWRTVADHEALLIGADRVPRTAPLALA
jgi:glutamine amidotransferase